MSERTPHGSKRLDWPHVGIHDDVLRIRVRGAGDISAHFDPQCPRCQRTKHPNVTRSAGWPREERHCNNCKIRWTNSIKEGFCSCYGSPEGVLEQLFYGHYGQKHTNWSGLFDKPKTKREDR